MLDKILTITICSLLFSAVLKGQQIWPGDVNNNGIVNEVDVLYWGIAFGSTGPERDDPDTDWDGYDQPAPWAESFASGLSYAFADCDGDGTVDAEDVEDAIEENFGLEHQPPTADDYSNTSGGSAARIVLQPSVTAAEEGTMVDINLSIDDMNMPVDSFYGLALSLSYTTELLEDGEGPLFQKATDSWLESDGPFAYDFYWDNEGEGQAAMAITRTNQISVPVEDGVIGTFSIVIEDIIVGLDVDTFYLQVDSVKMITPGQNNIPVVPDTAQVIVAKDLTILSTSENKIPITNINIFPNPMNGAFYIQSDGPLFEPLLFDQSGRALPLKVHTSDHRTFRVQCPPSLPPGLYWLRLRTTSGVINRKIIITP